MKTIIKIYREIEIPKEYEHLFKKGFRPNWKILDWDEVDLDWDSYASLTEEISNTLTPSDDWDFSDD